jgi:hypothetical protein
LETGIFVLHRIVAAVKRVEFDNDRIFYTVLIGRWCNIAVLNVHAPSEEKCNDSKNNIYEELEQVLFYHFPKYNMKVLLGYFLQKWGERIFSNRQLEIRVYIRVVMTMMLE